MGYGPQDGINDFNQKNNYRTVCFLSLSLSLSSVSIEQEDSHM